MVVCCNVNCVAMLIAGHWISNVQHCCSHHHQSNRLSYWTETYHPHHPTLSDVLWSFISTATAPQHPTRIRQEQHLLRYHTHLHHHRNTITSLLILIVETAPSYSNIIPWSRYLFHHRRSSQFRDHLSADTGEYMHMNTPCYFFRTSLVVYLITSHCHFVIPYTMTLLYCHHIRTNDHYWSNSIQSQSNPNQHRLSTSLNYGGLEDSSTTPKGLVLQLTAWWLMLRTWYVANVWIMMKYQQ
jgi:hypothetical protein